MKVSPITGQNTYNKQKAQKNNQPAFGYNLNGTKGFIEKNFDKFSPEQLKEWEALGKDAATKHIGIYIREGSEHLHAINLNDSFSIHSRFANCTTFISKDKSYELIQALIDSTKPEVITIPGKVNIQKPESRGLKKFFSSIFSKTKPEPQVIEEPATVITKEPKLIRFVNETHDEIQKNNEATDKSMKELEALLSDSDFMQDAENLADNNYAKEHCKKTLDNTKKIISNGGLSEQSGVNNLARNFRTLVKQNISYKIDNIFADLSLKFGKKPHDYETIYGFKNKNGSTSSALNMEPEEFRNLLTAKRAEWEAEELAKKKAEDAYKAKVQAYLDAICGPSK